MMRVEESSPSPEIAEHLQPPFLGSGAAAQQIRRRAKAVGRRVCTVLVRGETGSGKELVARQIHARSARAKRPFVPVDCTAFSSTLFESQFFGHVKGAFAGAAGAALGFFRAADGGTLFLDEIGELPLPIQAKLLRCIQDRAVVPLGAVDSIPVDVRLIAATHRDLAQMVEQGQFREDLYSRLNVVCVDVPPLRERRTDVAALAEHFLAQIAELHKKPKKVLSSEVVAVLETYDWPGNVRELENAIEHACAFCTEKVIRPSDLPEGIRAG